jgi:hypothetical protein
MKTYGGVDVQIHVLTEAPAGGEWSASRSEQSPAVPTGQEAGCAPEPVWTTWKGEISCPYRDLVHTSPLNLEEIRSSETSVSLSPDYMAYLEAVPSCEVFTAAVVLYHSG